MSAASPRFWAGPIRYCRWASREKPAYFWSVVLGALGPVQLALVPPVRKALGDDNAPPIPVTYPVPAGPRKQLTGYDDE
ncbi:NADH-ubiquinone oxidoreductase 9.5 kDa subunit [Colletotrichum sidae]|uniref:NADH-ubiquinone oxidoreductase 9.5 kDa subunit n=3 Tax=Colletotrichum orbiculare species complex TaxID=2707354 RepID=A0A4R8RU89_COLTR|nr:NADH-ubiquinone oxidoreductase 9.5 kDa subunit [Colletotrichum spinosum]TDZ61737.1 NADH-ubiquinone oxidoreductase 9.5 kDa subunit [Colletotrichum trifolii]TEA19182.1 NADH-ubiquinone oxidoreductase 9.5 kDa subunit [Colletotrichum sidae]